MDIRWRMPGLFLALAMLAGCAGMSSEECLNSDWVAIGYEDGSQGYPSERFGSHRKACAKHGVTADFRAYQEGRQQGLVEFCQPSRGFNLGASGRPYQGVCDAALEEAFLDAYRVGQQLYSLRSNVDDVNSRIYAAERELEQNKDVIRQKEAELIADGITPQERILLLADLKELAERNGELESEIQRLIEDRARHEYELRDYEASVTSFGY